MFSSRKPITVVLILFASVIVGGAAIILYDNSLADKIKPTTDQLLITRYNKNKAAFDGLLKIVLADPNNNVSFGIQDYNILSDPTERANYRKWFSEIDKHMIILNDNNHVVRFVLSHKGSGFFDEEWIKGIEYISNSDWHREGSMRASLDDAPALAPAVYLRRVDSDWYLFFQNDND